MTETTTVTLRGKRVEIDEEKRARVREEMPEIDWIKDDGLRRKVTDAWAAAVASSSFSRIGDMKPSSPRRWLPCFRISPTTATS